MAAPIQLLVGRGYQPVASPRFAVPYDVGTVNRVAQVESGYPGIPQDELPPMIESPDFGGGVYSNFPQAPDVGRGIEGRTFLQVPESAPSDIGMGIPVSPGEPVTSVNLDAAPAENSALRALASLGGRGGFRMPLPTPASPRRQVGSRPEFIYTNPVAAQQAAANYAARLGAETGQERGYQDYASRLNESAAANERARTIGEQQANQVKFASEEGAANRASAERIAGMSEAVRQQRQAEAAWSENERAADIGEQTAAMLNKDPNARVDRKFAWQNPATGRWESRFQRRPRPAPLPGQTIGTPVPPPAPATQSIPPMGVADSASLRPEENMPPAPVVPVAVPAAPSLLQRVAPAAVGAINPLVGEALRYFTR